MLMISGSSTICWQIVSWMYVVAAYIDLNGLKINLLLYSHSKHAAKCRLPCRYTNRECRFCILQNTSQARENYTYYFQSCRIFSLVLYDFTSKNGGSKFLGISLHSLFIVNCNKFTCLSHELRNNKIRTMDPSVHDFLATGGGDHKPGAAGAQLDNTPLRRSITEEHSPKFRRISTIKQPTLLSFQDEHRRLVNEIDMLQSMVNDRMNIHEHELLNVMRLQITRILEDVKKIVKVYNSMVIEKNLSEELQNSHNQVEYFKYEAVRLFEENRVLKVQIQMLRHQCSESKISDHTNRELIKKLAYKAVKNKCIGRTEHRHGRISKSLHKMPSTTPDSFDSQPNHSYLKPSRLKDIKMPQLSLNTEKMPQPMLLSQIHSEKMPEPRLIPQIHTENMPQKYESIEKNRNFITKQLATLINEHETQKRLPQKPLALQKRKLTHMKQRIIDKNKKIQSIKNSEQNQTILKLMREQ